MKEKKMVALSVGKKRKLGALSSMLAKTIGVVSLVAILASCGTSPGYSYTVGGIVSGLAGSGLVLQNNGGDDRSLSANGAFSFPTPLSDAAAYTITVKTQPTTPSQICTVNYGTGTINSGPVGNVVVNCVTGSASIAFSSSGTEEFAYVAKTNGTISDGTISAYPISMTNGTFGSLESSLPAGKFPASITVDPSRQFAYVANMSDNTISAYTINNPTDGTLHLLDTVTAGNYPTSVTVDPSGKFAYVANMGDNTISAYTISMTDGTLSPLGTPVAAGMSPVSIVTVLVGSLGEFAYVANMGDDSIWTYSINLTTGTLQPLSTITAGTSPTSVTVDPLRQFAYVTNEGDNTISAYTIDQTYGTLAASTITPTVTAGTNPTSIVTVSVGSSFAYATNISSCTISAYSIGTDGSLNELTTIGSPFSTGTGTYPTSITIDPSGHFAYVVNAGDGSIWAYPINQSTGALGTPSIAQ
jgi:6-phosphogluconolactonase (cycloisomerase 2 family)